MKRGLFIILRVALVVAVTAPNNVEAQQQQPGATQGGPTTGDEMQPAFDPRYYLGEWEIEWTPPDTGLFPSDKYTGTETVTHVNNRYLQVHVEMQGEEGTRITGDGMIFYDYSLGGQNVVRYVVYDAGFSLLQYGNVGGDLGGYYSHFWETPSFEYNDKTFALTGRSYYVSPAAYRVNQQISVDGQEFFNFGVLWMTKNTETPSGQ